MLTLSHIDDIKIKLSSIESIDELESDDKQLYELIEKHYTLAVGADVSQDKFSINVKRASSDTICVDEFENHHQGFLIDDKVVLELKVVEAILDVHVSQVISYLAASKKKVGLILNFAAERLVDGVKRIVL